MKPPPLRPVPSPFTYNATVVAVHDGDTIKVDIDLGFRIRNTGVDVRLNGLNAPELATPEGVHAKAVLSEKLAAGVPVVLTTKKDRTEKFGRLLADVWMADGTHVNAWLIGRGVAKPWDGKGAKPV